jgi:hypothetical protein
MALHGALVNFENVKKNYHGVFGAKILNLRKTQRLGLEVLPKAAAFWAAQPLL